MAKIDKDTLSLFKNPDDLISYIALHRFEPENDNLYESEHFAELPQKWADIVYMMDFESLFNTFGLFAFLESDPGTRSDKITEAFRRTGNADIARYLAKAQDLLSQHSVTTKELNRQKIEKLLNGSDDDNEPESNYPELRRQIEALEEDLIPVFEDCDYWENAKNNM